MIKRLVMLLLIVGLLSIGAIVSAFADDTSSSATMDQSISRSDLQSTVPDIAQGWIGEPQGGE